jgi:hypothetical protein
MKRHTLALFFLAATGTLSACAPTTAVVHGQTVARPTLGYTDNRYFAVKHELAYPAPRGPSSGLWSYGGRIVGDVCGASVNYESEYYGHFLDVSGFVSSIRSPAGRDAIRPVRFEVRDDSRRGRSIFGMSGSAYYPIELYMKPESIEGVVGQRHFQLHELDTEHNELRGTVRLPTFLGEQTYPFVVRGVQELWSMPAADQAVLVPMMMSCLESTVGNLTVQAVLSVDFRNALVARR